MAVKVAMVTGAGGAIGRAIARTLAGQDRRGRMHGLASFDLELW
jgi:NAD(P)-dependent dehydrogenase (short-subunit alcohol dehydrogenase family)